MQPWCAVLYLRRASPWTTWPGIYTRLAMSATPVYQNLEFCRDEQTLWRKIESKWDWLGVKPDGTYVVGYPRRREVLSGGLVESHVRPGARPGEHGVIVSTPLSAPTSETWLPNPDEAREAFTATVSREQDEVNGPGLIRVLLVVDGVVQAEEFIARRHSTYR
jgi:hypothetical protein